MSVSTLVRSDDDFDAWESELTEQKYSPTKAARRRADDEAIDRQLGLVRHRSREREL